MPFCTAIERGVVARGEGVNVAAQVRQREGQLLLAFGRDPDAHHADLALAGDEVVDQRVEGRFDMDEAHAEVFGQCLREVDVDALQGTGAGVAEADAVVVRPDADLEFAAGLDVVEYAGLRRQGGEQAEGECKKSGVHDGANGAVCAQTHATSVVPAK